jgi:uncharacterized membrane protein
MAFIISDPSSAFEPTASVSVLTSSTVDRGYFCHVYKYLHGPSLCQVLILEYVLLIFLFLTLLSTLEPERNNIHSSTIYIA